MRSHDAGDGTAGHTGDSGDGTEGYGWWAYPADPDVAVDRSPGAPAPGTGAVVAAVAIGGAAGAAARYGATLLWPSAASGIPWSTLIVNLTGCAAMGVLMVLVTERSTVHPLVRPLLGTGVLGGYTTFSTATLQTQGLMDHGRPAGALAYLVLTLLGSLAAIWAAAGLTRLLFLRRRSTGGRR